MIFVNKQLHSLILALASIIMLSLPACKPKNSNEQAQTKNSQYSDPELANITAQISQNAENPDLLYQRAAMFYEKEAYDEAISDLNKAILLDSLKADYYHLLSDSYLDYYQSKRALNTLNTAVELFPNRIPTLLKLSETQFILKQYIESLNTLNRIIRIDPQNAEAYFMLGMNFRESGDKARAMNSFQTATEIEPELIDAWIILGSMYEDEERPEAKRYYENALRIDSSNIQALHSMAFYLQNHEDIQRAINLYKKINRIDPQYGDAYLNAGILQLEQDSINLAFEQFNILANIDPSNYMAYYYRGICFELLGKPSNSKADFQSALNISPDFERAQKALERISKVL